MAYIYKITNTINDKSYIGKTEKANPQDRFKEHLSESKKDFKNKRPLYDAFKKYGSDMFTFEVLEETSDPNERETFFIAHYNTYKEGYNATLGGDGKSYITNQQEIVDYYLKYKPFIKELAEKFNICTDSVVKILKQFNIEYNTKARHSKTILQKDKNGNLINEFESAREAALSLGNIKLNSHIVQCCDGTRKSIYGFKWEYK